MVARAVDRRGSGCRSGAGPRGGQASVRNANGRRGRGLPGVQLSAAGPRDTDQRQRPVPVQRLAARRLRAHGVCRWYEVGEGRVPALGGRAAHPGPDPDRARVPRPHDQGRALQAPVARQCGGLRRRARRGAGARGVGERIRSPSTGSSASVRGTRRGGCSASAWRASGRAPLLGTTSSCSTRPGRR